MSFNGEIEGEELRAHLAQRYGFRARTLYTLDQGVTLLRRDDGPSWVARVFNERPAAAVAGEDALEARRLADVLAARVRQRLGS
ncbi:MAG: hypothetical protein KGL15_06550 [Acidobacteriota bacterium]|nr:hypothetical protein [Acidobacteriota bacterium]